LNPACLATETQQIILKHLLQIESKSFEKDQIIQAKKKEIKIKDNEVHATKHNDNHSKKLFIQFTAGVEQLDE